MVQSIPVAQTTQTTVTTQTTGRTIPTVAPAVAPVANIINKDALITNVMDKPVLGNIIEKQNVEVVHKPVVQEIHEQRIIELEKQNVIQNVKQETVVQRATDATRYEEIGNRDLEAERLRLAQLNVTQAPLITKQAGLATEVRQGEVVAQVVRQEHIERHVQPVITEVREQNLVKEVVHPIVRKVHEETIVREVGSTTLAQPTLLTQQAPLLNTVGTTQGINANSDFGLWERNMYNAYNRDQTAWNREKWLLANPQPIGYQPTGFLNQYPLFKQYHSVPLSTASTFNSAPLIGSAPLINTTSTDPFLTWERNMYTANQRYGSSWDQSRWLRTNPQPIGYKPTGFLNQYPLFKQYHSLPLSSGLTNTPLIPHQNIVEGGKLPTKLNSNIDSTLPLSAVPVTNPQPELRNMPTDGTLVPTTTLGETPAHTHEVLKGAAVGAAVGSVVPVVGTVVGGVVGAIGGAIAKKKHIKEGTHAFKN